MKTSIRKKILTPLLIAGVLAALTAGGWLFLAVSGLPDVRFLAGPDAVVNLTVRNWSGEDRPFVFGPANPSWTPLEQTPQHLRDSVLSGEDFSFYAHNGVDWYEVRQAIVKDLREKRFARGASTITQQVAKNLFLSREKTFRRKVRELALARQLEKSLAKDRILELYLNLVELGDGVYGVGAGARHHFDKEPVELSLRESTFLAAMLPGPRVFDPDKKMDKVVARSDHILAVMLKGRMVTEEQYLAALADVPTAFGTGEENTPHGEGATLDAEPGRELSSEKFGEDLREETSFDSHSLTEEKPIVEIPVVTPE